MRPGTDRRQNSVEAIRFRQPQSVTTRQLGTLAIARAGVGQHVDEPVGVLTLAQQLIFHDDLAIIPICPGSA